MEMTDRVRGVLLAVLVNRRAELESEMMEIVTAMEVLNLGTVTETREAQAAALTFDAPATVQPSARSLAQRRRWAKRKK